MIGSPQRIGVPYVLLQGDHCYYGVLPETTWQRSYCLKRTSLPDGVVHVMCGHEMPLGYERNAGLLEA